MRRALLALVLALSGCGASSTQATTNVPRTGVVSRAVVPSPPSPIEPAMEAIIQGHAGGGDWTVIPLAQVDCGTRSIAIVWPAMDRTAQVVDDDVVGWAFERHPGADPVLVDSDFLVRGPDLEQCLGAPARVRRGSAGLPRDMIADALLSRLRAVQHAASAHDRTAFRDAVMLVAELFDDAALFEALTDALAELVGGRIVLVSASVTAAGISITARDDGDLDEATLPLVPVPGRSDVVVIRVD